jgi:uncharacterized protein (TIGR02466 family)
MPREAKSEAPSGEITALFVTRLYKARLPQARTRNAELEQACRSIAADDEAGQSWSEKNGYPGYTSYASLNDLTWRNPAFEALAEQLQPHASAFAETLELDLNRRPLTLNSLWINILPPGGFHAGHIHPHSVISGTYYVAVPKGAAALKLEDPRLGMMMAAPPRKARAALDNRSFVYVEPAPGMVLLWESWLRHEVPLNTAAEDRISISFNYGWG